MIPPETAPQLVPITQNDGDHNGGGNGGHHKAATISPSRLSETMSSSRAESNFPGLGTASARVGSRDEVVSSSDEVLSGSLASAGPAEPTSRRGARRSRKTSTALSTIATKAHDCILAACSENLEPAERSNAFDQWRDLLVELASVVVVPTTRHRQVIGLLLPHVGSTKDVVDFSAEQLRTFSVATYALRRAALADSEVAWIRNRLRASGLRSTFRFVLDGISESVVDTLTKALKAVDPDNG